MIDGMEHDAPTMLSANFNDTSKVFTFMPVKRQLGIDPLHDGVVLVIGTGIGLFVPPLGRGLYRSCLIGGVTLEETVRPIMKHLGLLLVCLIVIALVPQITTALPRLTGC